MRLYVAYESFLNPSPLLLGISEFVAVLFLHNTAHLISFMDKLPWPQETIIIWRLDGENRRIKECWSTGHTAEVLVYTALVAALNWLWMHGVNPRIQCSWHSRVPLCWEDFTDPSSCLLAASSMLLFFPLFQRRTDSCQMQLCSFQFWWQRYTIVVLLLITRLVFGSGKVSDQKGPDLSSGHTGSLEVSVSD